MTVAAGRERGGTTATGVIVRNRTSPPRACTRAKRLAGTHRRTGNTVGLSDVIRDRTSYVAVEYPRTTVRTSADFTLEVRTGKEPFRRSSNGGRCLMEQTTRPTRRLLYNLPSLRVRNIIRVVNTSPSVRPSVRASKSLRSSVTHHPLVFTVLFIEIVRKQQRLTVHDDTRGATKRITTDVNNILYPAVPRLSQRAIVVKVDDEVCAAAADFRYTRPTCVFAVWRGSSR